MSTQLIEVNVTGLPPEKIESIHAFAAWNRGEVIDGFFDDGWNAALLHPGTLYRRKPFDLIAYIESSFGPLHGRKPHRDDWTREMLEGGWRPLLKGEIKHTEDESSFRGTAWALVLHPNESVGMPRVGFCRTRRPLPAIEPVDPYAELKAAHKAGKVIQVFTRGQWRDMGFAPSFDEAPENYRIKPEPDAEGWIAHDGGPCPVAKGTPIEVKLRNGQKYKGKALEGICMSADQWVDDDYPNLTIIAYRIAKPDVKPWTDRVKSATTVDELKALLLEKFGEVAK